MNACSSSPASPTLFRTPTAQLAVNGGSQHPDKRKAGGHGPTLADEVEHLLPTPNAARIGSQVQTRVSGDRRDRPNKLGWAIGELADQPGDDPALLPTPVASDTGRDVDEYAEVRRALPGGPRHTIASLEVLARNQMDPLLPTPRVSMQHGPSQTEVDAGNPKRRLETEVLLFPTPTSTNSSGNGHNNRGELLLPGVVQSLLPTPCTSDANGAGPHGEGSNDLRTAVSLLPTPTVADSRGTRNATAGRKPESNHHAGTTLSDVFWSEDGADQQETVLLPTPRATDTGTPGRRASEGFRPPLSEVLLPTPWATDGTKGGPNQRGSSGDKMLPSAVVDLLPTPRARDGKGRDPNPKHGVDLNEAVDRLRPEHETTAVFDWGAFGSAIRRWEQVTGRTAPRPVEPGKTGDRLSPRFVEWMMGLVPGHVTAVPKLSRNAQLKALGNGVVPHQAAYAIATLLPHLGLAA